MKYLAVVILCTVPVWAIELQIGPSLGLMLPGNLEDAPTHPGPGIYYGGVGEYAFSRLLSAELGVGGAIGLGEPLGDELPCLPSYSHEEADFVSAGASLTANLALLSLSAGMGYYYIHMNWEQTNAGSLVTTEWKSLEVNQLGYSFALGFNLPEDIDFRITLHFPEMEDMWGVVSLNWKPFKI
jgi:hypothetical protein